MVIWYSYITKEMQTYTRLQKKTKAKYMLRALSFVKWHTINGFDDDDGDVMILMMKNTRNY